MKKRIVLMAVIASLAIAVTGCSTENADGIITISAEDIGTAQTEDVAAASMSEAAYSEENSAGAEGKTTEMEESSKGSEDKHGETQEKSAETNDVSTETEAAAFTFADLSKRQFEFSSGAGAWSEEFTIEKDGYFTGSFHDADMGDTGEGYANGTRYSSSYFGHFTDLTRVNDHTYQMKLEDISYEEQADTSEIIEGVRYIYTKSYCLEGADTFTVYLPGTPLEELSQDVRVWISMFNGSETELTMTIIANEAQGYGIYSFERRSPLEDAQMTFNTYKESCDYYGEKVSEAYTTVEMVDYTAKQYELSDECLNYIWNLVRYHVDEDEFDEILAGQRAWIAEKEAKAKEASGDFDGGSFAAVSYNNTLAELTMKRCEELIEYLK